MFIEQIQLIEYIVNFIVKFTNVKCCSIFDFSDLHQVGDEPVLRAEHSHQVADLRAQVADVRKKILDRLNNRHLTDQTKTIKE